MHYYIIEIILCIIDPYKLCKPFECRDLPTDNVIFKILNNCRSEVVVTQTQSVTYTIPGRDIKDVINSVQL